MTETGLKKYFCLYRPLVFISFVMSQTFTFNLDGSPGSYVMYPPWEPCLNGSFSFEFKTEDPHSLLLYLNKGKYFFFEVRLFKGSVRLRINTGEGTMNVRAGEALNDGRWHKIQVRHDSGVTFLKVDGVENSKQSPGILQNYVPASSNETFLFIGGLPMEYESKKHEYLALPSVTFEPRFRGSIRNFFYSNCGGEQVRPTPLESSGILTKDIDLCEQGNPCLNGGRCLTTDNGIFCDCASTDYKGDRCDIQKIPSDATFLGTQYISYNLSNKGDVMVSNQDQIMLDFRTKQASSLLFYTGNGKDYITVGLVDGGIFLSVNLGSGLYEASIRPSYARFDDNHWHQLVIRRDAREVNMELDGMYREQGSTSGKFVRLSSSILFVAGSPSTATIPGSKVKTNFKGCMRKVRYHADSIRLDLTELARKEHGLLDVVGDVIYDKCQELVESQPVTFTVPEAYVTVPTWDRTSSKGSLAFQFRTVEPGGLMMYSNGDKDSKDFFALELLDGHLYLVLDMGSGIQKVQASKLPITDGNPHDVYFEFTENKGYISTDGQKEPFSSPRISDRFDLHGHLYVGGLGPEINVTSLPRELWAAMLGLSYVGCIQDLVINGNQVDLVAAAKLQNKSNVVGYCRKTERQCLSFPCSHQGKCLEGWNRFTCDCRATGFVGNVCQTAAVTLRFDGTQFMKISMATESITQAEDISLRFRTMHPNGLLFLTTSQKVGGMELYLDGGVLHLSVNVGSGAKILSVGHTLNDDRWHTVFIKRRVQTVEVAIDQDRPVTDKIPGSSFSLVTSRIYVGHVSTSTNVNADLPGRAKELGLSSVEAGHMAQQDESFGGRHSGFIGSMQTFVFNGNNFFQMAKSDTGDNIEISARFSSDEYVVQDPVTFKSPDAFAILPQLQAHDKFSVTFQLKTTESDGLILYNGGRGQDFFAMELSQGFLFYVYDMGEGPQRVKANVNQPINDNKWHEVRLLRAETYKQLLRVDDSTPTIDDLTNAKNNKFDLDGHLYVGGVRKTMYPSLPKHVHSQHGFVGCLGSLDFNGYLPHLLREASQIHDSVGDGCRGPQTKCVNDSCDNHGRCVQQWTSYKCDCDMTSYTGPMCKNESVSYIFGPGPGLMTFAYPEGQQPSTNFESLAFGFQTFQSDAVLLRMDSKNFDDFIQLELANGLVYLLYNMGTFSHPLGNFFQKVNDGRYHVVRFTRAGPNATLQIDSYEPQMKNPIGPQHHTFNNQAFIRVGGKKADNGSIVQHFVGIISGLVVNGIHIFELAKQNDPQITFEGNVSLNIKTPPVRPKVTGKEELREMQSTQGLQKGKRMKPTMARNLQVSAGTFTLDWKMPVFTIDQFGLEAEARVRTRRNHHNKLNANVIHESNLVPEERWRNYVDPEPDISGHKATTVSKDAYIHPSDYEDGKSNKVHTGPAFMDNQVKQFWSEYADIYTSRQKGVKNVYNHTAHINDVENSITEEHIDDTDYDYDEYDREAEQPKSTTPKPRCEYSGPEKLKAEPHDEISDTAETENNFRKHESEKGGHENSEDYSIFDVAHPDYDHGNLEELYGSSENSVNHGQHDSDEMQEAIEIATEFMKNHQESHKKKDDSDDDEDLNEVKEEGSGYYPAKTSSLVLTNMSEWSALGQTSHNQGEMTTTTTLPYLVMTHLTHSMFHTTTGNIRDLEWEYIRSHTTSKEGVTDDIIIAGPGSGCRYDDEEDCSEISSGTEEIITAVVISKKTTPPLTTSTRSLPLCTGPECVTSSKLSPPPSGSPPTPSYPETGNISQESKHNDTSIKNGFSTDESTAQPHKDKSTEKGINLGLILGITGSVLVAVIVLCIALCKLRSRDEGTYKVDETQNFSALHSKKSTGNGALASGSDSCAGKRGKKKDVKEWYV